MTGKSILSAALAVCLLLGFSSNSSLASEGKINQKINELQKSAVFTDYAPFSEIPVSTDRPVPESITKYSLVKPNSDFQAILDKKPAQIRLNLPYGNETL